MAHGLMLHDYQWAQRREDTLQSAQAGISQSLGGNQVFLDVVIGERSEAPMRLVRELPLSLPLNPFDPFLTPPC